MKCPNWNDPLNRDLFNDFAAAWGKGPLGDADFELLMKDRAGFEKKHRGIVGPLHRFYTFFANFESPWLEQAVEKVKRERFVDNLNNAAARKKKKVQEQNSYRTSPERRKLQRRINREKLEAYRERYRQEGLPLHATDKKSSNRMLVALADHLVRMNPALNIEFVTSLPHGARAMVKGNTYYLDVDRADVNDLLHEHGHMVAAVLKVNDPEAYAELMKRSLEHPRTAGISLNYPELTTEQLGEEVFAELLAERAAEELSPWWGKNNGMFDTALGIVLPNMPLAKEKGAFTASLNDTLAENLDRFAPAMLQQEVRRHRKELFEFILEENGIDPSNLTAEEVSIFRYHLNSRRICL